ncbi:MAG: ATP-binding protein [Elusimicrobiota bacterium]
MLIQFTVGNFRSFKEKVTLSMVKSALHELPENVIKVDEDIELLKSVVVYGANASGKSNLIRALNFIKFFVMYSISFRVNEEIGINNFILNEKTISHPSFFEVVFIIDKIIYRYGFEVDDKKVNKEWLYYRPKTREEKLFSRDGLTFDTSNFPEGKGLENKTRENCSFLSVVSQFNGEISSKIVKWFSKLRINISGNYQSFQNRTIDRVEKEPNLREDVVKFISIADNGIEDFRVKLINTPIEPTEKNIAEKVEKEVKTKLIYFVRKVFNIKNEVVEKLEMPLNYSESEGTKKMFALSVPIIDAIRNGEIMIMDELENSLHPLLFKHIIKLFNSASNTKGAQLIFTTHNLTCMDNECFRRDQIWFTEKNSFGESTLFSLADYKVNDKKIRNDATYSKDYLLGKYGAVPFIDDIDLSFEEKSGE